MYWNVGHRNVYVAVHIPYVVPRQRKHHHRRRRKKINVQQERSSGRHTPLMEEVDHLGKINKIDDSSSSIYIYYCYFMTNNLFCIYNISVCCVYIVCLLLL